MQLWQVFIVQLVKFGKTSKFDWTPDDITIEKMSRFLEWHMPHLKLDSRSFNYSIPKEGSSEVVGERNPMQQTDIKYQFNKTFPLLIK